jgi:hypothetical protein
MDLLPKAFEKCGLAPINRDKVLDRIPSILIYCLPCGPGPPGEVGGQQVWGWKDQEGARWRFLLYPGGGGGGGPVQR